MVRFSDIIKLGDKTVKKEKTSQSRVDDDRLWWSESQILKIKGDPGPKEPSEASIAENEGLEIISYYEKFLERAMEIRDRVKNDRGISPSPILADLHYVIDNNIVDELYEYAMSTSDDYEKMMLHTVDVTFASLRVGKGMGYDTKRLLELGLASFQEGRLDEQELAVIRNHPEISYQALSRLGKGYEWLAETALQVHERSDGSGYPKGLKGEEISEIASIIGLIDTYVALIKNRPYRDKLVQTDAIKFIIKEAKALFPAKVLKGFLNQISLFPVNTIVRLNNKSIGRVLSTDKNQPLRPTIELLYSSRGNRLQEKEVVRLAENPLLYIIESINESELP
jgi:HD-GYP domain-containing protein (c-di-GMP phosphodiesterase class II)